MAKFVDQNAFGIIGIGRFGLALANELLDSGKHVIALDKDESRLQPLKNKMRDLYRIDSLTKEALGETGIGDCAAAVVCIGKDLESNLLATLNLIELGIPRVISKAISDDHGLLLKKLGAEVVYPEVDMGTRLAWSLTTKNALDFLALNDNFSIVELELSHEFDGKSLKELNFRNRFGLNVITVIRDGKADADIRPDTVLCGGAIIVVAGNNEKLHAFQEFNAKHA
ncbi:potassium channel family protein [Parasphaerochaeta coccoides]|uniref:TrkA-N domain protein n=1 Tax=Parasphaerochaeta coccoides (strain ATCC BAA-1237 / DSM 17374 / SPN1) TaxID=760011 RepID=F4GL47_PARC1|nr:TrkA family potassium uptake protein [Parasphaerochaeta coccoides]AEC02387.1 TrkA-N domain protein [Parasphaerochaeta coccoides DSM 17374]